MAGSAAACRAKTLSALPSLRRTASRSVSVRRKLQQIFEDAKVEEDEEWYSVDENIEQMSEMRKTASR